MFKATKPYAVIVAGLCTLASGLIATSIHAQDIVVPTATVHYGDLNLNTGNGVSVLYQRLRAASKQVCRAYEGRELAKIGKWQACYDQALSAAVRKVNLETLNALHRKVTAHEKLS